MNILNFETPLWSINPEGKLFQRHIFGRDMKTNNLSNIVNDLYNYANYKAFNWVIYETSKIKYIIENNILIPDYNLHIKTNTSNDILPNDIVFLKCHTWKEGKYFLVIDVVEQDYVYSPKRRELIKHLSLQAITHGVFKRRR